MVTESPVPHKPARRTRRWGWLKFLTVVLLLLTAQAIWSPVVLQLSDSVERGVWVRWPGPIDVGDHVYLEAPESVEPVLAAHGYPASTRLFKPVVGVAGDVVSTSGSTCLVNAVAVGSMDRITSQGDPMPRAEFNATLGPDELWLASATPTSLDSRCFGSVSTRQVRGPYVLLWSWSSPPPEIPPEPWPPEFRKRTPGG